jgi:hypothetical protein
MREAGWPRIQIATDEDGSVEAVAPAIVSASRRTDLPAFHADWLAARLRAGYVAWRNPFGGRPQYVSFARTRAVVFWTKNPRPLLPHLGELDRRGIGYYVQFTLNDYQAEGLEPSVPPLAERLATFRRLASTLGRERVVWRFDPLLLADGLPLDRLLERVLRIGDALRPHTEKLVIAFADIARYARVRRRLGASGAGCRELTPPEMREFAEKLAGASRGWGLQIATCAEAVELADLGIRHNRCVDDALLERLFPRDAALQSFLGPPETRHRLKDPGQREACGCIRSKDIGSYGTCLHGCRYCYAGSAA